MMSEINMHFNGPFLHSIVSPVKLIFNYVSGYYTCLYLCYHMGSKNIHIKVPLYFASDEIISPSNVMTHVTMAPLRHDVL